MHKHLRAHVRAAQIIFVGALPQNEWKMSGTSGKNHFYMGVDDTVPFSGHEKERKQEDIYTKTQAHS